MKGKQIFLSLLLIDFLALTGYALAVEGLSGMVTMMTSSAMSALLTVDLLLALGMLCAWMVRDARERGRSVGGFLLLTLLTGSGGPLLYLILRDRQPHKSTTSTPALA